MPALYDSAFVANHTCVSGLGLYFELISEKVVILLGWTLGLSGTSPT